jgi:hypothetical protein
MTKKRAKDKIIKKVQRTNRKGGGKNKKSILPFKG